MEYYLDIPSELEIRKLVLAEIVDQLNIALNRATPDTEKAIQTLTRRIIKQSAFMNSLVDSNGQLRGEFGLRKKDVLSRQTAILDNIVADTYLFYHPVNLVGNTINGGWILAMGQNLFANLKRINEGMTLTEKGVVLPWMQWTLERGNAIIIGDFGVRFRIGAGRSGLAIMVPDKVVGWRVPPKFSGTDYDNWITREVLAHVSEYEDLVGKYIMRNL